MQKGKRHCDYRLTNKLPIFTSTHSHLFLSSSYRQWEDEETVNSSWQSLFLLILMFGITLNIKQLYEIWGKNMECGLAILQMITKESPTGLYSMVQSSLPKRANWELRVLRFADSCLKKICTLFYGVTTHHFKAIHWVVFMLFWYVKSLLLPCCQYWLQEIKKLERLACPVPRFVKIGQLVQKLNGDITHHKTICSLLRKERRLKHIADIWLTCRFTRVFRITDVSQITLY